MGHYQMNTKYGQLNTESGRSDPRYNEIFEQMRDMEYTVAQSRMIAWEACYFMNLHPDWTKEQAIGKVLE